MCGAARDHVPAHRTRRCASAVHVVRRRQRRVLGHPRRRNLADRHRAHAARRPDAPGRQRRRVAALRLGGRSLARRRPWRRADARLCGCRQRAHRVGPTGQATSPSARRRRRSPRSVCWPACRSSAGSGTSSAAGGHGCRSSPACAWSSCSAPASAPTSSRTCSDLAIGIATGVTVAVSGVRPPGRVLQGLLAAITLSVLVACWWIAITSR